MKTKAALVIAYVALAACGQAPSATSETGTSPAEPLTEAGKQWVTTQYLDRRTCPSEKCGIVGRLSFREAATPLETRDGWVRVSKVYDAACESGRSKYVDKGDAICSSENGITDGRFAEWVRADALSVTRPADPAATASADESLIAGSDDFAQHRRVFAEVTQKLISDGRCTADEFKEQGGWVKSVNEHRDEPVYFAYCGGMTASAKIYINAETGQVL